MTISRHIVCEDCGGSFWHKVEFRSDPNPDECPLCHNTGTADVIDMRGKLSPKIAQMVEEGRGPATSMLIAKSTDGVYRGMENASHGRSLLAAEHMGVDPSETAHMRITNLRDNLREGDVAAKLPVNPVSQAMAEGKNTGFAARPEVLPGQVMAPSGGAGLNAIRQTGMIQNHRQTAARLVKAGEAGRYTPK